MSEWKHTWYMLEFQRHQYDGRTETQLEGFFFEHDAKERGEELAREWSDINCRFKVHQFEPNDIVRKKEYPTKW